MFLSKEKKGQHHGHEFCPCWTGLKRVKPSRTVVHGEAELSELLAHGSWHSLVHMRGAHSGPFQSWARFPSQACYRGDLWALFTRSPVLTVSGQELTGHHTVGITNAAFVPGGPTPQSVSARRQAKTSRVVCCLPGHSFLSMGFQSSWKRMPAWVPVLLH